MNKGTLERRYRRLVSEIDSMRIYDGRDEGVDVYVCERCGSQFYTRYKDKGVTPFVIRCRREACNSTMSHRLTISEEQAKNDGLVVHNWVRPTLEQLNRLRKKGKEPVIEHVLNGGLMLEGEI